MRKIDLVSTQKVVEIYREEDYSTIREKYNDPGTKYAFDSVVLILNDIR